MKTKMSVHKNLRAKTVEDEDKDEEENIAKQKEGTTNVDDEDEETDLQKSLNLVEKVCGRVI